MKTASKEWPGLSLGASGTINMINGMFAGNHYSKSVRVK